MMTAQKKANAKFLSNRQQKQRGYSLIELSVAVIVIGFMVAILANIYPKINESTAKQQSQNQSQKLEQTILGFVFATGRLPCPASNMSGVEDCSLEKGELAYRTLGLATPVRNQAGVALRYAVFDKALTSSADMELTVLKDRYEAYIATDDNSVDLRPVAQQTILNTGNPNNMDMCQALLSGSRATNDATKLHTGSGTSLKHIAYLIHDLGLEDADNLNGLFDGSNTATATDLQFNAPTDSGVLSNDDRIYVKSFEQLWADLDCGSVMSAVGHAHPNTATASAIMNQALADYKVQAELGADVAGADIAAAAAAILSGASGTAAAAATIPIATSESINTAGAAAPTAALSVAAVVAAAASVVTASVVTAMAAANKIGADQLVVDVNTMLTEINGLNSSVYANAVNADAAGLYQQ